MSYYLKTFGSVELPRCETATPVGTGPALAAIIPTLSGFYDADGAQQSRLQLPYELPLKGEVSEASAATLLTTLDALRALRGQRLVLTRANLADAVETWCWARLLQAVAERVPMTGFYQAVQLRFLVESPWYGTAHADLISIASTSNTFTLTNGGNTQTAEVLIIIVAGANPVTALTLATGDCALEFAGTVTPGTNLQIDGGAWSVLNNGAAAWGSLTRGATHCYAGLWRLLPGANVVTLTYTGGGAGTQALFVFSEPWE